MLASIQVAALQQKFTMHHQTANGFTAVRNGMNGSSKTQAGLRFYVQANGDVSYEAKFKVNDNVGVQKGTIPATARIDATQLVTQISDVAFDKAIA